MSGIPEVIDRYALYAEIASGGSATVHLGRRDGVAGFSRVVAVKRLHPHNAKDPEFAKMFLDEARLAARIVHPNVVSVEDVVDAGGELLLVMQYVHGDTVQRLTAAAKALGEPVPVSIVVAILLDTLRGLSAAHEARGPTGELLRLVHRDVSPHNIMVGSDGTSRIMDFGIAKALGRVQATTDEGRIKGKAAYMSPEQVMGETDARADVWAASVVAWELLTGERLFASESDVASLQEVLTKAVPPLEGRASVPPALAAAVHRGLERSVLDRWKDAAAYADAVAAAMSPAPVMEVADWVSRLAAPTLAERDAQIQRIEQGAAPAPRPPRKGRSSPPRRRMALGLGVASASILALALSVGGVLALRTRASPTLAASTSGALSAAAPAESEPSSEPVPILAASSGALPARPPPAGARAPQRRPVRKDGHPAPSAKQPSVCQYVDAEGIVKFRPCN